MRFVILFICFIFKDPKMSANNLPDFYPRPNIRGKSRNIIKYINQYSINELINKYK